MTPNELNQVDAIVTKAVRHEVGQLRNEIQTAITELHEVRGRVQTLGTTAEELGARLDIVEKRTKDRLDALDRQTKSLDANARHLTSQLTILNEATRSNMQASARDEVRITGHQHLIQEFQNAIGRLEVVESERARREAVAVERAIREANIEAEHVSAIQNVASVLSRGASRTTLAQVAAFLVLTALQACSMVYQHDQIQKRLPTISQPK